MRLRELINTKLDSLNIEKEDRDLLKGLVSALLYEKDLFIEQTAIADKDNQKLSDALADILSRIGVVRNCLYVLQKEDIKANTIDEVIRLFEEYLPYKDTKNVSDRVLL